ncbi:MAG: dipeptide epimerase [Ignavibacteriales bacterium]|nr:dipeptide epimerase [Ignavibacteriales bacterium]
MKLTVINHELKLKHAFAISSYTRTTTPVVLIRLEHNRIIGYGEASLPQYLKETQKSVRDYLNKIDLSGVNDLSGWQKKYSELLSGPAANYPALAALDIAMHDLFCKILGISCHEFYNIKHKDGIITSFTIGIDSLETIKQKIAEAEEFGILKIKLGRENDKEIINTIRSCTGKPLYVDINQGWKDVQYALDMIHWLNDKNVILIEQPMPVENRDEIFLLKEKSPLPIIADEAVQKFEDIDLIKEIYSGINIKLMKCGGMSEAFRMIKRAEELNLKIMLGCMTETSCGISAALQFAPLADFIDLDGNLLISNDPFESVKPNKGKLFLSDTPGLGINLNKILF